MAYIYHADIMSRIGQMGQPLPTSRAIAPGSQATAIWIEPTPHLVVGKVKQWADDAAVQGARIPAYWYDAVGAKVALNAPPAPGEKVVLALHGGGYVYHSAYPGDAIANIPHGLLQHVRSVRRIISVEYRLSRGPPLRPANPFPTALIDAVAAYDYLINTVGFEAQNIIIMGDSAGANLALALTRYVTEHQGALIEASQSGSKPLTPPGGLILCSPWVDLGSSHIGPVPTYLSRSDYLGNIRGPESRYAENALVGPLGLAAADTNVHISPGSKFVTDASYAGWPRTFIVCGGAEAFAPSIRLFKERMAADMGEGLGPGRVLYYEAPDAVHDYMMLKWHEPERSQTLRAMAEWIDVDAGAGGVNRITAKL
jgi:acetyl esterase/lipase